MDLDDASNPLMVEIQQERASAYFEALKKMVTALERLQAFDGRANSSTLIKERNELLHEAAERVLFVLIQREAMNFSGYEKFFDDYGVPDEVRKQMGKTKIT